MSYEEQDHEDVTDSDVVRNNGQAVFNTIARALSRLTLQQTEIMALTERVDALEAKKRESYDPDCNCPECTADRARMTLPPPAPGADEPAGDAFVDALCREYARRFSESPYGPTPSAFQQIYWQKFGKSMTVDGTWAHFEMLAHAAALPERSAPAPVTITRERLDALSVIWQVEFNKKGKLADANSALLNAIGIEVTE